MIFYDKYSRSQFLKTEIVDNVAEKDFATNSFAKFVPKRTESQYMIGQEDIGRPDLISLKSYGKNSYWCFILKRNDIEDPFNELEEGDIITIPNLLDIQEFYNDNAEVQ
jgi:hypothetical protein